MDMLCREAMLGNAQQPSLSISTSTRTRKTRSQVEVSVSDSGIVNGPAGSSVLCRRCRRRRRQQQQSGRQRDHVTSGVPPPSGSGPPSPLPKRSRPPLGFKTPCKSFVDVLGRFARSLGRSPLGVVMQAYLGSQSAACGLQIRCCTPCRCLFRSSLWHALLEVWPRRDTFVACHAAKILFGHFGFLQLGCPRQPPVFEPLQPNAVQTIAAENLAGDVLSFLRLDRGFASFTLAGGRARLAQQLLELTEHYL